MFRLTCNIILHLCINNCYSIDSIYQIILYVITDNVCIYIYIHIYVYIYLNFGTTLGGWSPNVFLRGAKTVPRAVLVFGLNNFRECTFQAENQQKHPLKNTRNLIMMVPGLKTSYSDEKTIFFILENFQKI